MQVLEEYSSYADGAIGKWGTKRDGTSSPNVKALVKPLIGMMHGERGTKKWKQEIDRILKDCHKRPDLTVSQIIQVSLPWSFHCSSGAQCKRDVLSPFLSSIHISRTLALFWVSSGYAESCPVVAVLGSLSAQCCGAERGGGGMSFPILVRRE